MCILGGGMFQKLLFIGVHILKCLETTGLYSHFSFSKAIIKKEKTEHIFLSEK